MFHLRELERKDLPVINKWRNDPELICLLGAPFRYINLDIDIKWYESYLGNRGNAVRCAITEDDKDLILGLVSLTSINYLNQSAEFHIMIGDIQNQGRGIGTFAVKNMLNHAFKNMNLHRVELTVLEDNARAKHLYEKCGFVYEGKKRKAKYKNGKFVDMLQYSILKSEFKWGGVIPNLPTWQILNISEKCDIDTIIHACDEAYDNPVTERSYYAKLLNKIHQKGRFIVAYKGSPLGYCAFYANDTEQKTAYISLIAMIPKYQAQHIGSRLLKESFELMKSYGMQSCSLEVRKTNKTAIQFYMGHKFTLIGERKESYLMKREL